ncbi:MAG: Ig-like domain-containing protein [Holophagales bacterium]|jgi:uncharacterized protein YjdB|nr:Ig-like domain-containing protein [Holophagales bacterium]
MRGKIPFIAASLLALGVAYVTCGGGGGENPPPAPPPPISDVSVTGIALNRNMMTLAVGDESSTLVPAIYPENATNKNVAWASSNMYVATVSASGVVTPVEAGSAVIMATTHDGNQTADCIVEVVSVPIPAEDAYLNKNEVDLLKGGTDTLAVNFVPVNATNQNVTWMSSNPSIATVDKNGVVTAISEGDAEIVAMLPLGTGGVASPSNPDNWGNKVKSTTPARRVAARVSNASKVNALGVSLDRKNLVLTVGSEHIFFPTVQPYNASNVNVTWKSSDAKVAAVSTLGVVTGKKAGYATITVTTKDGGHTDTCEVLVEPAPIKPTGITLNKTTLALASVGSSERLTATVSPSNATDKRVYWLSSDQSIAVVNENGTVQARGKGTATIIAQTVVGNLTARCDINVGGATVNPTSVTLNKKSLTLPIGDGEILIQTVLPSNATNKSVTWSSSNPSVATVSNGVVVAKGSGNAAITVTTVLGGVTATCQVTVTGAVSPTGVSLNKASTTLSVGGSGTLVATVSPSNATDKSVTWTSGNPSVATVNSNGLVTGVSAGTTVITVATNVGNKMATCLVTVNPVSPSSVSLNKTTITLSVGSNETLVATVSPSNAANKSVTWTSSNPSVATVSNGVVTGVTAGTATITVATVDGNKTATCAVTVNTTNVTPTSVSLNKASTTISVGNIETLVATVLPSNATNKSVTWTSSNPSVATVSNGVVTGVTAGAATITVATVDGNKTATCAVTVSNGGGQITGVSLNKTIATIRVGGTETLVATVSPSNATNKSVTWASSNPNVATVNTNGLVAGVSAGSATISVSTQEGGFIATCAVTVTNEDIPPTGVSLNKTTATISVDGKETLVATVSPSNATNKNVTWVSSNPSVATVNNGEVTGVSAGSATIIVSTQQGGFTAFCSVTVNPPHVAPTGVVLNKSSVTLTLGASETLVATVSPSNATNKSVTWTSTSPAVASVSNGLVTGLAAGSATIIATTQEGGFVATCNVTVLGIIPVTGIMLEPGPIYLTPSQTKALVPNIVPANATNKNVTWSISFSDASDNSASVDANGVVTCLSPGYLKSSSYYPGDATVTARTADGGYVATVKVVTGTAVTGLSDNTTYYTRPRTGGMPLAKGTLFYSYLVNRERVWMGDISYILNILPSTGGKSCTITLSTSNSSILGVNNSGSSPSVTIPTRQTTGDVTITATVVCNFTGQTFTRSFPFKVQ